MGTCFCEVLAIYEEAYGCCSVLSANNGWALYYVRPKIHMFCHVLLLGSFPLSLFSQWVSLAASSVLKSGPQGSIWNMFSKCLLLTGCKIQHVGNLGAVSLTSEPPCSALRCSVLERRGLYRKAVALVTKSARDQHSPSAQFDQKELDTISS